MVATRLYPKFMKDMPQDLSGKVFVITGTTSGTGYVAAKTVASLGGEAVLLNRKSERSTNSLKKLQQEVPHGKFVPIECDLQTFASVRKAIADIKHRYNQIYCLANNAGIMATPDEATIDGYDKQIQTNHLSHFLLTEELLPLLEKEAEANGDARIVNHSSLGRNYTPNKGLEEKYFLQNGGKLGGNDYGIMTGGPFFRYFQSKLANSVITYGLHNKLQAKGKSYNKIRAIACHPGGSDTNLADHMKLGCFFNTLMIFLTPIMMQTAEDGALGLIKGMIDPAAESGELYGPKKDGTRGWPVSNPPKSYENDPKAIDMLWRTSVDATGCKTNI